MAKFHEIPDLIRDKYTRVGRDSAQGWFKISQSVFNQVRFLNYNLNSSQLPNNDKFDLVLCRNVMIYFSKENVSKLIQKFHGVLLDNATLIVSHTEVVPNSRGLFRTVRPSIYNKN